MITIQPATLRDISYVTANLAPDDRREVMCQVPDGSKTYELAYALLHSGDAFCALIDDLPVAAFGTSPITVACYSVWMVGTKHARRAVPAITRHMMNDHGQVILDRGAQSMEARSIAGHHRAHRWMVRCGAVRVDPPYPFGKNGEMFYTFRWTRDSFAHIREQTRTGK